MTPARAVVTVDDERVRVAGSPYLGTAGTEHDVVNATDCEAVFLEIE
jgi:hypothetical protein